MDVYNHIIYVKLYLYKSTIYVAYIYAYIYDIYISAMSEACLNFSCWFFSI